VIVSGTVENQGRFYDRLEHVVRRGATLELDRQRPVSELADAIERRVTGTC